MTGEVRAKLLTRVADHLAGTDRSHPTRVAVDGITAAGKSTFARELRDAVAATGRPAVHLSTDDFHHVAAHRHRDPDRARGYYRDAYDLDAFRRLVLDPLGPAGDLCYRARSHDLDSDELVDAAAVEAARDAVVIVDGSFLQSAALRGAWDEIVWLDTGFERAARRGADRDAERFGGADAARAAFAERYHAACRLYLHESAPADTATIVVDHDDVDHPRLRRIGGTADADVQLFSYGTLQQPDVQAATFGRELPSSPDILPGHRTDWVTITDADVIAASGSDWHPIVRPSGDPADTVAGTVLSVSPADLAAADTYEVAAYRRHRVRLASSRSAWVYLDAGQA